MRKLAIYLRMLLPASFHRSGVNRLRARSALVPHERTRILRTVAATRLVWTAVILNSSETSGPLSNGRILKMCSLEVYIKSFGSQKGGSLEPPRTPPAYGPVSRTSAVRIFDIGDCTKSNIDIGDCTKSNIDTGDCTKSNIDIGDCTIRVTLILGTALRVTLILGTALRVTVILGTVPRVTFDNGYQRVMLTWY